MDRLRAALSMPAALALLAALALMAFGMLGAGQEGKTTQLEARVARALSAMEGVGEVQVVIRTREAASAQGSLTLGSAAQQEAIPCGAVAVAQGAADPLVRMQLTQALCALLGLDASCVDVVSASEGGR